VIPFDSKVLPDASKRYIVVEYAPPDKYGNPIANIKKSVYVVVVRILPPIYPV
jgi:hypothetical protein